MRSIERIFMAVAACGVLWVLYGKTGKRRNWDRARQVEAGCLAASSGEPDDLSDVTVYYRNGSDKPVYDLTIYFEGRHGVLSKRVASAPPGLFVNDADAPVEVGPAYELAMSSRPVVITFRDPAGWWWKKDHNGDLTVWDRKVPTFLRSAVTQG